MELGNGPTRSATVPWHRQVTELHAEHGMTDIHAWAYEDRCVLMLANDAGTITVTTSREFLSDLWESLADLDAAEPDARADDTYRGNP